MVESFAVNCGISFMHALMYQKMENSVKRSIMAQNIMINKKQVTMEDVAQVLCCKSIHNLPFFDTFEFLTRSIILPETVCYLVRMFDELNYMSKFKIRDITLIKFFLTIQASYGDNAYRNWHQGFAAGHFVYCVLKQLSLVESRYISPVEGFALIISAFCFNVDCFGSINPFLLNTKSILANFYTSESRVRSRHALNQTLIIMNMEGCNILEGLTDQEYSICIEIIKDLIHAADISFHFKFLHKQKKICAEFYQNFNPAHRYYFCCLIITAAVLSDFAKDWLNTKRISWFCSRSSSCTAIWRSRSIGNR
ncbi:hypothetical protein WA026_013483 [Henosepilachna vigintioctopunctata]|uniref:PDEase domain-containing protein n=1 Tax=Henosepilachna vigintioctopunctata TaxID=420089 RepID=A0AAW1VF29_9CUCU